MCRECGVRATHVLNSPLESQLPKWFTEAKEMAMLVLAHFSVISVPPLLGVEQCRSGRVPTEFYPANFTVAADSASLSAFERCTLEQFPIRSLWCEGAQRKGQICQVEK